MANAHVTLATRDVEPLRETPVERFFFRDQDSYLFELIADEGGTGP
jgi:hypothetical protein